MKKSVTSSVLERWLRSKRKLSPKAFQYLGAMVRAWKECFGNEEIQAASDRWVERLLDRRLDEEKSGYALNQERMWLKQFFRWCEDLGYVTSAPTMRQWRKAREVTQKKYVVVGPEEERRLVDAARELGQGWLAQFIVFGICTGLREGTVRKIRWGWVKGANLELPAGSEKAGAATGRTVPLAPRVLEALGERKEDQELLIPMPICSIVWRWFKRAVKRAGVDPAMSPHDLRRTFCARLRDRGVAAEDVRELGGWETMSVMLEHYFGRIAEEKARAIVERL